DDRPLRGQRHQTERPQPGQGGSDREVGYSEGPGEPAGTADHGVDLLGADHRHRHDRTAGLEAHPDEAAPTEALEPVAIAEELADPLHALREDAYQLVL